MKRVIKRFAMSFFSVIFFIMTVFIPAKTVSAKEPETPAGENTAWIRAKLRWQYDAGVTGLEDDLVELANDGWSKSDGWYYYNVPVNPGDRIRLINGVKIPYEWDNETVGKNFRLIITVEAGEAAPGDTGWNENTKAVFSEDFTAWGKGYQTDEDIWVKEGSLSVRINEYQLNKDGTLATYINDKIVVPGQFISKIVEIEIDGEKGGNIKLIPEKPVKHVYAGDAEVDGKIVPAKTALRYEITVKNPSPDVKTITIYDTVDKRLVVTDPHGAKVKQSEKGTLLTWTVDVKGNDSAAVMFYAVTADGISDKGEAIPNNAEADIAGKRVKSNTVVIGTGPVSDFVMALTRATGDYGVFGLCAFAAAVIMILAVIILLLRKHKRRKEGNYEKD